MRSIQVKQFNITLYIFEDSNLNCSVKYQLQKQTLIRTADRQ